MQNYTITPWRHPSDLLTVRNKLYTPKTPTEQAHAISTIAAWKLRGNVPHAVESTALLFDAMLFHARCTNSLDLSPDPGSASVVAVVANAHTPDPAAIGVGANGFAIRAAYTTALSRFVTGFADLGRHKGGVGQSMFEVARTISLPPHFVELRHEVAHEDMPGLARLVRSAREAVQWLWGVYWGRLLEEGVVEGVGSSSLATTVGEARKGQVVGRRDLGMSVEEVRDKSRVLLKEFRSQRVAKLKSGKGKNDGKTQVAETSEQCLSFCHGGESREKWEAVVSVLVEEGLMVPSLKKRGPVPDSALQGAYMLWDELLLQLAQGSDLLMDVFFEKAIAHNAAFTSTDSDTDASDPAKGAVYRWMMHILYSDEWEDFRTQSSENWESAVLRECTLYPDEQWSKTLAEEIEENQAGDDDGDVDESDEAGEESMLEPGASSEVDMEDTAPSRGGWRRETGPWKSLAIGVVES